MRLVRTGFEKGRSGDAGCAGRSPAEIDVGIDPSGCTVLAMNRFAKLLRFAFLDQVDGTASETAARHASSITTGNTGCDLNQCIELAAAGLEVITDAAMRLGHQDAEGRQITALERRRGKLHTLVLGDDVTAAAKNGFRHLLPALDQLLLRSIAQGHDGRPAAMQNARALFDLCPAGVIFPTRVLMLDHG